MHILGKKISLKILTQDDVGQSYLKWMNDIDIVKYLDNGWRSYTIDELKVFVKQMNESNNNVLFGIYYNDNNLHIGNIKIGNINFIHRYGSIGLIIGEKEYWGKGIGTESIKLITDFAFSELNLNKVTAGLHVYNIGTYKAFIRN